MAEQEPELVDNRGRPRRFDDRTERRMLLDAAMALMIRRGYPATTVAEVLATSGLSTRSFYRHFESKDALLAALVRREVDSVTRHLTRATTEADDPVAAVEAWIDAFLDTFFEPRRSRRGGVFVSAAVRSASPLADELDEIRDDLCRPLATVLRAGAGAGVLVSPDPDLDAACIFGVVAAAAGPTATTERRPRAAVRAQVLRFARPALGITRAG